MCFHTFSTVPQNSPIEKFALNQIDQLKEKHQRRQPSATADCFICDICPIRVVQGSACSHAEELIADEIRCIDDSVHRISKCHVM